MSDDNENDSQSLSSMDGSSSPSRMSCNSAASESDSESTSSTDGNTKPSKSIRERYAELPDDIELNEEDTYDDPKVHMTTWIQRKVGMSLSFGIFFC